MWWPILSTRPREEEEEEEEEGGIIFTPSDWQGGGEQRGGNREENLLEMCYQYVFPVCRGLFIMDPTAAPIPLFSPPPSPPPFCQMFFFSLSRKEMMMGEGFGTLVEENVDRTNNVGSSSSSASTNRPRRENSFL